MRATGPHMRDMIAIRMTVMQMAGCLLLIARGITMRGMSKVLMQEFIDFIHR
jgi:hypothetical protein